MRCALAAHPYFLLPPPPKNFPLFFFFFSRAFFSSAKANSLAIGSFFLSFIFFFASAVVASSEICIFGIEYRPEEPAPHASLVWQPVSGIVVKRLCVRNEPYEWMPKRLASWSRRYLRT
nr:hypothetical protein [Pandoravirus aubagnensis]